MYNSYWATERQREVLYEILPDTPREQIDGMTNNQAHVHISCHAKNWRASPASEKQRAFLRQWGLWREGLSRGEAWDLIAETKARLARMTPAEVEQELVLARRRMSGMEGGGEPNEGRPGSTDGPPGRPTSLPG